MSNDTLLGRRAARHFIHGLPVAFGLLVIFSATHSVVAQSAGPQTAAESQTYDLKYRFSPGEAIRWNVEHRADVRTTINGTAQTAETLSRSVKLWRVVDVAKNGNVTFEHLVESIDMRQKFSGRQEVTYNSATDENAPPGFEDAAKSVGIVLSRIVLDDRGNVVKREHMAGKESAPESPITIPLPDHPLAIGDVWSHPYEVTVPLENGGSKKIETRQRFSFDAVNGQLATIGVETQILTPINDAKIEAQLVHLETKGKVRFDLKSGRVVSQQMDLDKSVVGAFGPTSSVHYKSRFSEELVPVASKTAQRRAPAPAVKSTVNK
ncbi:MAG: hypothetical protein KDA63_21415 [Planctomycetales bacterium]|nr:hypothetical protein [Planctomycetales bacterium]